MHIVNFLAKNLFKINGKYVSKKSISLKVSFCYGPRPWCPNSSKKWLKINFALAGQQNDDDVGPAEFHENFFLFLWKWLSFLLFCFFNVFRRSIFYFENQFRNTSIYKITIVTYWHVHNYHFKKKLFISRCDVEKLSLIPCYFCYK